MILYQAEVPRIQLWLRERIRAREISLGFPFSVCCCGPAASPPGAWKRLTPHQHPVSHARASAQRTAVDISLCYAAAVAPEGLEATLQGAFAALISGGQALALVVGGVLFDRIGGARLYGGAAVGAACVALAAAALVLTNSMTDSMTISRASRRPGVGRSAAGAGGVRGVADAVGLSTTTTRIAAGGSGQQLQSAKAGADPSHSQAVSEAAHS